MSPAVALGRDNYLGSVLDKGVGEMVDIITLVGNNGTRLETIDSLWIAEREAHDHPRPKDPHPTDP